MNNLLPPALCFQAKLITERLVVFVAVAIIREVRRVCSINWQLDGNRKFQAY